MSTPKTNLLRIGAEEAAEIIKRRMLQDKKSMTVYVDDRGGLRTQRCTDDGRRLNDLPVSWLVGNYTPRVPQTHLEDDLSARIRELSRC